MQKIRWGILGTGSICKQFATGLQVLPDAEIAAVGSRSQSTADAFASNFGVPRAHASYEALAADPEVDVIYIGTPHPLHLPNSLLCLEHGKHVLCEKPVTVNGRELEQLVAAAKIANRFLMEAMWMYFNPNLIRAEEMVRSGAIGELRMVQANFGFRSEGDESSRLIAPELAGGSLLDVGIYPIALASLFFQGPPERIQSEMTPASTGVDAQAAMLFRYPGGGLATLTSAVLTDTPYDAWLMGENGMIKLHAPFWGRCPGFTLYRPGQPEETFSIPLRGNGYDYEAEAVMACLRDGQTECPRMPLAKSIEIMATMDTIRAQWGLKYPFE